jgi:hypothetical protein
MVVGVETLIRFLDPQQFLLLRPQGIEDCLAIALGVDEQVSSKLRHERRHFDVFSVWQRGFLIEAEARQLAKAFVHFGDFFRRIEVQVLRTTFDKGFAGHDIEQDQSPKYE